MQPGLIEAMATHPELEEVKIMGTLRCQTVEKFEEVRDLLIRNLQRLPKLRNFILEPVGDKSLRLSEIEPENKK